LSDTEESIGLSPPSKETLLEIRGGNVFTA